MRGDINDWRGHDLGGNDVFVGKDKRYKVRVDDRGVSKVKVTPSNLFK